MTISIDSLCPICEEEFIPKAQNQRFCSRSCANKHHYRRIGRDKHNARMKKYRDSNPEKYMLEAAKARAKRKNIPFELEVSDIIIPSHCPVLGIELRPGEGFHEDSSPSLDRLKPALGYVKGNVNVISLRANKLKSDGIIAEFEKILQYMKG